MGRIYAGLIFFFSYCFYTIAFYLPLVPEPHDRGKFDVYFARFNELRKRLPPRGVVGYIDDLPKNPKDPKDRLFTILTRFALAPVCVEYDTKPDLIVVNSTKSPVKLPDSPALTLVQDFGNGVKLYKKAQ